MKPIKLLGIILCLALAAASTAFAQGGRPSGPRGGGMGPGGPPALPDSAQVVQIVDEIAVTLELTADQKEQILGLHFDHFEEARELMSDRSGDREGQRQKMAALREEFENAVSELLDENQNTVFKELRKTHARPSGNRSPRRR